MAVGLPEGPSYSRHIPETIFLLCFPLNDHRRAPHSFSKIGRQSSTFFCLFLARLRLLVLLLLLMSGNVHPNPGPIFPCSVCTGNVTWRGKSVQCCTSSEWVHLRCSRLSLSKFITLGRSHSSSCPPAGNTVNSSTVTSIVTPHCNTVTSSSDSSGLYTSTVKPGPSPSANAALPPHPRLQTAYTPSAHSVFSSSAPSPPFLAPGCPSTPPAFSLLP